MKNISSAESYTIKNLHALFRLFETFNANPQPSSSNSVKNSNISISSDTDLSDWRSLNRDKNSKDFIFVKIEGACLHEHILSHSSRDKN